MYNKMEEYDVSDSIMDQLQIWKRKLQPWRVPIIITCSVLIISLVVFLGFAWIEVEKCNSVGGMLDAKMVCHPGYYEALESCEAINGKLDADMKCHTKTPLVDFTNWEIEE